MFFKVTNESKGPRFVVGTRGRAVVLPGEKNAKRVDIEPEVARQYVAAKDRGRGASLTLQALDDEGRAELGKPLEPRERRRLPPDARRPQPIAAVQSPSPYDELMQSDTIVEEEDTKYDAKAELLSRADGMSIDDLRTEAKMVLGKDWPDNGDRLNKAGVKRLLED